MAQYSIPWIFLIGLLSLNSILFGQSREKEPGKPGDNKPEPIFYTTIPKHDFDIILGRPTQNTITISMLFYYPAEAYVAYYAPGERYTKSEKYQVKEKEPTEINLGNLRSGTRYSYQVFYKHAGNTTFNMSQKFYFQTQREKNAPFIFTISADSHLDQNTDTLTYKTTLLNIGGDSADFHIDLGDTYMTDKYRENYKDALNQYIAQRYYLGMLCHSSPLFFVQGNHDGEAGQRLNGKSDNMTVWSNLTRKKYFPNPVPNDFYTGNATEEPFVGLPQNYYAWEWGNALFITLDPFWYTTRAGVDDPWQRTLGKQQYDWLKVTLEKSKATFKFVFIHHLVGGADLKGKARGGAEVASLYEWGGHNSDGSDGFKEHRPGWDMPIHDLLVKNNVTVVFHGHDHFFAKQELNGITYQCLPQPGSKDFGNIRQAEEYGYKNGVFLNGPGYMRVSIIENRVLLEYVSTHSKNNSKNKEVVYSYELKEEKL